MCDISIIVAVYNHENYVEQALNSILMQDTTCDYEVLIGEDCSTDNSRKVLKEIEKKVPSNFKFFFREHNYGGTENFNDLYRRAKGKYLIVLEGDDYWLYPEKLQKEFDFLEKHPEYIAVAHNTVVVGKNGNVVKYTYPECHKAEYTYKDFVNGRLPGQTTTIMYRNYHKDKLFDTEMSLPSHLPGDKTKSFLLVMNGRIGCIQEKWSAYRIVLTSGSSYSANHTAKSSDELNFYREALAYVNRNCMSEEKKNAIEDMYAWYLIRDFLRKYGDVSKDDVSVFWHKCRRKACVIGFIIKRVYMQPYDKMHFWMSIREADAIRRLEQTSVQN